VIVGRKPGYHLPAERIPKGRRRVATYLTPRECEILRKVRRFVVGFCGDVSDAEVLRYLVRNWSQ